jgi:hypothetical protein
MNLNSLGYKTEIHDIQIKDISGKLHEIYRNDNVHIPEKRIRK